MPYLDLILIMTVEPGFGGQSFMHDQMAKIETCRKWIDACDHDVHLAVDGGIAENTIGTALKAGADTFIAGSAVFKGDDYAANINKLRKAEE